MTSYWNPRRLLDVYPQESQFTCVGTTLEGLRCRQSFLRNIHKAEADRLLDLLPLPEEFRAHPNELLPTLRHLAWLTLCPRWHQNGAKCQADAVAARWLRIITSSTPAPTTYTYGSYQAPTTFPLSPPRSPLLYHPPVYAAAPLSQTYHTYPPMAPASIPYNYPPAVLQPASALSSNQESPRTAPINGYGGSGASIVPQVTSSIQTTNQDGSTRIDINISVVLDQPLQTNTAGRAPEVVPATSSLSSQDNLRSEISSDYPRSTTASTHSRLSSSSVSSRAITLRALQDILARLESLERQAARSTSWGSSASHRSSRSPLGASRSPNRDPRSPVDSTMSDLHRPPPPIGDAHLYFSPPRSPAPRPHVGSLSISTDSRSASSVVGINTPSSSGSSTPAVLPPPNAPAAPAVLVPAPATPPAAVQRRPVTTCNVCYDDLHSPTDAVWCRGTCGQNVCLHCMNTWIETLALGGRSITCPHWYIPSCCSTVAKLLIP